jgi:hypothetical protein
MALVYGCTGRSPAQNDSAGSPPPASAPRQEQGQGQGFASEAAQLVGEYHSPAGQDPGPGPGPDGVGAALGHDVRQGQLEPRAMPAGSPTVRARPGVFKRPLRFP